MKTYDKICIAYVTRAINPNLLTPQLLKLVQNQFKISLDATAEHTNIYIYPKLLPFLFDYSGKNST